MSKTIGLKNKIEENIKYYKTLLMDDEHTILVDPACELIRQQIEILQNTLVLIHIIEPTILELSDIKKLKSAKLIKNIHNTQLKLFSKE